MFLTFRKSGLRQSQRILSIFLTLFLLLSPTLYAGDKKGKGRLNPSASSSSSENHRENSSVPGLEEYNGDSEGEDDSDTESESDNEGPKELNLHYDDLIKNLSGLDMNKDDDRDSDTEESLSISEPTFDLEKLKRTLKETEIYKQRLFVGEADFSYTVAFIKKHPNLAKFITATEFQTEQALKQAYPNTFEKNIQLCKEKGVKIKLGVDATKLHENTEFKERQFERIHFNFPMTNNKGNLSYEENKKLIKEFFESAWHLQRYDNRIHITLPHDDDHWRDEKHYDIFPASSNSQYQETKRHKFKNRSYLTIPKEEILKGERYFGYEHVQDINTTGSFNNNTANAIRNAREHVFIKVNKTPEEISGSTPPRDAGRNGKCKGLTKEVKTDSESSSDQEGDERRLENQGKAVEAIQLAYKNDAQTSRKVGNCLFDAVAVFVNDRNGEELRRIAVEHIRDDQQLRMAIEQVADNERQLRTMADHDVPYRNPDEYLDIMGRDRTWGTYIEIVALARALQRPITIYMPSNARPQVITEPSYANNPPIFLNYIAGDHYEARQNNLELIDRNHPLAEAIIESTVLTTSNNSTTTPPQRSLPVASPSTSASVASTSNTPIASTSNIVIATPSPTNATATTIMPSPVTPLSPASVAITTPDISNIDSSLAKVTIE